MNLSILEKEMSREFNIGFNFDGYKHKKKLKCSNCRSFKEGYCLGKGFGYKDVLRCMEGEIEDTPVVIATISEL